MYTTQFVPLIIRHLNYSRELGCLPFEFNSKSGKFVLIKDKRLIRVAQLQSILTLGYFLVILYHFCLGGGIWLKKLQGLPFLICYAVLVSCRWNVGLDIAPAQLINSMVTFEKGLLQGKSIVRSVSPSRNHSWR